MSWLVSSLLASSATWLVSSRLASSASWLVSSLLPSCANWLVSSLLASSTSWLVSSLLASSASWLVSSLLASSASWLVRSLLASNAITLHGEEGASRISPLLLVCPHFVASRCFYFSAWFRRSVAMFCFCTLWRSFHCYLARQCNVYHHWSVDWFIWMLSRFYQSRGIRFVLENYLENLF